jgi:hypothetical protein
MVKKARESVSLKTRVPVSIAETGVSHVETASARLSEFTRKRERSLVGLLVHQCGWILGQDGNLYNPEPQSMAWGERVA